jgi:hypothetical protein
MAKTTPTIYLLHVSLREISPRIWRRFEVPSETTLPQLHIALQIVMGWENYHLHEFRIAGRNYAEPDPEDHHFGRNVLDERRVRVGKLLAAGSSFEYHYDFGDNWRHDILIESVLPVTPRKLYPVCLAGARSAPPEDVGGIGGYQRYLEALFDHRHPDHEDMLRWRGRFDPESFAVTRVNKSLREAFPVRTRQARTSSVPATFAEEFDMILSPLIRHRRLPRLPKRNPIIRGSI